MSAAELIVSVTFDGFGMNDATDTYRRRVATFAPIITEAERKQYAALWVKAPELAGLLQSARNLVADAMDNHIYNEADGEVPPADCAYLRFILDADVMLKELNP